MGNYRTTVLSAATALAVQEKFPQDVILSNLGSDPVYVWDSPAVSDENGFEIPAGSSRLVQGWRGPMYGITDTSAAVNVTFLPPGVEFSVSGGGGGGGSVGPPGADGPEPSYNNQAMYCAAASTDSALACATALAATPVGRVDVFVAGRKVTIGNGAKDCDGYFSADGTTARAHAAIVSGDFFYWMPSIAGIDLTTDLPISFDYNL